MMGGAVAPGIAGAWMCAAVAFPDKPLKVTFTVTVAGAGSKFRTTVAVAVAVLLLGGTSWSPVIVAEKVFGVQLGPGVGPHMMETTVPVFGFPLPFPEFESV
jgi:hypothetical protein